MGTSIPAAGGGTIDRGTLVTLGSNSTNWDFATGLNGDTDGDYEISGQLTSASGTPLFTLQPNAISANQNSVGPTGNSAGVASAISPQTTLFIGDNSGSVVFLARLTSKSGRIRFWKCSTQRGLSGTVEYEIGGMWQDTVTVITSLRINSSIASAIAAGSWIRWRRLGFTA